MAALLFLFLLGEHSWFAFSNLKEKHPLSFLRRNDGGRISSGCQPCGRRHLSRAPRPMPGGRGWQPAGCTRNGCAARKSLEVCRLPRSELCPAQDGFSAVSNDEFCPVLNTTNSLVWLRKVCGCAYYTATRRQKWAARVWQIASDHLCILFVIPSDLLNSPAARRRVKEQILRAYEGGITTHGND